MSINLEVVAEEKGIRYFLMNFTDLFGVVRSKLIPASAIKKMQKDGGGVAGHSTHLDMSPADGNMYAFADTERLIQLPWRPEVRWLPCSYLCME